MKKKKPKRNKKKMKRKSVETNFQQIDKEKKNRSETKRLEEEALRILICDLW